MLSALIDHELSAEELKNIWAHLKECLKCCQECAQLCCTDAAVEKECCPETPSDLWERVKNATLRYMPQSQKPKDFQSVKEEETMSKPKEQKEKFSRREFVKAATFGMVTTGLSITGLQKLDAQLLSGASSDAIAQAAVDAKLKEMIVLPTILMDKKANAPIIFLKEVDGNRQMPIWIGMFEANAIKLGLEGVKFPRPITHDFIKNIFDSAGVETIRAVITKLQDSTFYAEILFRLGDRTFAVDCRPSDAIAVCVRTGLRIFVDEEMFSSQAKPDAYEEAKKNQDSVEEWKGPVRVQKP
jgi:bifunctional DNase/RNase